MLHWTQVRLFRPSLKQILFGGLGSGIGVMGLFLTIALYIVETLIRPKKVHVFDLYSFSPFELDLPAEEVSFTSLDGGHTISAWYIPRAQATTTIVLCPGYRSRKSDLLGLTAFLWKAGHNVLVFDYYGHGTEVGTPVTLGYREINDFLGAVAYAKARAPEDRLGVVAYSMGAAVAIMSCARSNDVEALVADSSFATHWSVVDYNLRRVVHMPSTPIIWLADYLLWWRAGYRFRQVEPLRDIGRISPRPVFIIQGGKDSIVDPRDAALLYGAAGEPKELWVVPEADHCGTYFTDRSGYVKRVIAFFDLYLKNQRPHLQLVENVTEEQAETSSATALNSDLSEAS